jgi:uncharacterized protein (DUF433 family)
MSSKEIAVALIDKLPEEATLMDIAQQIEMAAGAEFSHIRRDAHGRAWIDDCNVKVIEVVLDYLATGSTPEEIHIQFPHLSLAQIRAALAFYHDNRDEFDAEINRGLEQADSAWAASQNSPLRQRLRALGKEARLLVVKAVDGRGIVSPNTLHFS